MHNPIHRVSSVSWLYPLAPPWSISNGCVESSNPGPALDAGLALSGTGPTESSPWPLGCVLADCLHAFAVVGAGVHSHRVRA